MCGIGPAISDHYLEANDRDVHDASNRVTARHQHQIGSFGWSGQPGGKHRSSRGLLP
jgi:hypothetical protein